MLLYATLGFFRTNPIDPFASSSNSKILSEAERESCRKLLTDQEGRIGQGSKLGNRSTEKLGEQNESGKVRSPGIESKRNNCKSAQWQVIAKQNVLRWLWVEMNSYTLGRVREKQTRIGKRWYLDWVDYEVIRQSFVVVTGSCCWCSERSSILPRPKIFFIPLSMLFFDHLVVLESSGTHHVPSLTSETKRWYHPNEIIHSTIIKSFNRF